MGPEVDLSIHNGDLVVKPVRRKAYQLDKLVRKITARNLHGGDRHRRPALVISPEAYNRKAFFASAGRATSVPLGASGPLREPLVSYS